MIFFLSPTKKKGKPHSHCTFIMKSFNGFSNFAKDKVGRELAYERDSVLETCLSAMEDGELNVLQKNNEGCYLWAWFTLTQRQWERTCAVLQKHGIESSVLWDGIPRCLKSTGLRAGIEYLWEDLDGIEKIVLSMEKSMYCSECKWVKGEFERRRAWSTGLRRAWLVAVTRG
jgi:hypothetical protein